MTTAGFSEAEIQRVAGPRSFARGIDYVDAVTDLDVSSSQVTASVDGTHRYRVTLTVREGQLDGMCSCPHGQEGSFCKHCVAVGLAVLELDDDLPGHVEASETSLRSWLESLSKQELLAELLNQVAGDPDLRRRFEVRAATEHADPAAIRRAVRELIEVNGYIEYDQAWDYAHAVGEATDAIASLVDAGGAAQAIAIAREAIALLTAAYESADDSSGAIGDSAHDLLTVHLSACQAAPPDPVSLADYLAGLLLNDGYGLAPELDDYGSLLGDTGSARIRQRIAAAFAARPHDHNARRLMKEILSTEGDVDGLIANGL